MPIIQVLKVSVAALFSLLGLVGLFLMFSAEQGTAQHFSEYFRWAIGAGLVFLAMGLCYAALDKEDVVLTQVDSDKAKK